MVLEYDGNNSIVNRFVHGNDVGADDPLIWYPTSSTADSNIRNLYADPRGSIVLVQSQDGTAVNAINTYDEWGANDGTNLGRFQYTGQVWLPEIGMYYYKARIYSQRLGRFMQADPVGYKDQINLYAYVGNDPTNAVDPAGLYDCGDPKGDACKAAAQAIGQIKESRDWYAAQGTKAGKQEANVLSGILETAGTMNDKNGIMVRTGDVESGTGSFLTPDQLSVSEGGGKNGTITLDTKGIAGHPSGDSLGATFGHEVRHQELWAAGIRNAGGLLNEELNASSIGYIIDYPKTREDYKSYIFVKMMQYIPVQPDTNAVKFLKKYGIEIKIYVP